MAWCDGIGGLKQFMSYVAWGELDYLVFDFAARNR